MTRKSKSMILALAALFVLAVASMAGAHASRQKFTPGPDAVVSTAPNALNLAFTEDIESVHVEVFNSNGDVVTNGQPVVDPANPAHVTVPLQDGLPEGTYTVKWQNRSTDGHTSSGRYQFHITSRGEGDNVRVFLHGKEVVGDVPAQIIDGRTMVPVRALAEAMNLWVTWDGDQKFVVLSNGTTPHMHHKVYEHPADLPAPTIKLHAIPDAKGGFNLKIETTNWTWAPEQVNTEAVPNAGHGHLYVDGVKIGRLYGPWYHLSDLTPGQHDIHVTLNANDHADYAVNGQKVEASVSVVNRPGGNSTGGEASGDTNGHDHKDDHDHKDNQGH